MNCTKRLLNRRYKFYDLVLQTPNHPQQPMESFMMSPQELQKLRSTSRTKFEGNYSIDIDPKERISKLFGTRISGETRQSSSRVIRGEPRVIMGVKVPDKPPEPDNCCMSGCINCVWELFKDDIKEWNDLRKQAADKVNSSNKSFIWPEDFDPPVKLLKPQHIPPKLRETKAKIDNKQELVVDQDPWNNVPIAIRIFADTEKKIKEKKRQKQKPETQSTSQPQASA